MPQCTCNATFNIFVTDRSQALRSLILGKTKKCTCTIFFNCQDTKSTKLQLAVYILYIATLFFRTHWRYNQRLYRNRLLAINRENVSYSLNYKTCFYEDGEMQTSADTIRA